MKKYGQYPSIIHNVTLNSTIVARFGLLATNKLSVYIAELSNKDQKLKLVGGLCRILHWIDNVRLSRKRHQDRPRNSKRARDMDFNCLK